MVLTGRDGYSYSMELSPIGVDDILDPAYKPDQPGNKAETAATP